MRIRDARAKTQGRSSTEVELDMKRFVFQGDHETTDRTSPSWDRPARTSCQAPDASEAYLPPIDKTGKHQDGTSSSADNDSEPTDQEFDGRPFIEYIIYLLDLALLFVGYSTHWETIQGILERCAPYSSSLDDTGNRMPLGVDQSSSLADSAISIEDPQLGEIPPIRKPIPERKFSGLLAFENYLQVQRGEKPFRGAPPVKIPGYAVDWPACGGDIGNRGPRCWTPEYLKRLSMHGLRHVPIEVGSSYTSEDWHQKIMPFGKVLDSFKDPMPTKERLYLAQYDLFLQFPALLDDIGVPEFCYSTPPLADPELMNDLVMDEKDDKDDKDTPIQPGEDVNLKRASINAPNEEPTKRRKVEQPSPESSVSSSDNEFLFSDSESSVSSNGPGIIMRNVWIGPAHTVTPLHTDPHHNCFVQIRGFKYIRLYPADEADKLAPMTKTTEGIDMSNTSTMDVAEAIRFSQNWRGWDSYDLEDDHDHVESDQSVRFEDNRKKFEQNFPSHITDAVDYQETILGPGDCLFIPRGWWHYVRALTPSASVSYWWDS
jgi:hypothetical protein